MKKRKSLKPLDKTADKVFKNHKPPLDLAVSEWAARNRVLTSDDSAEPGPWRNERTPHLVEIMDAYTDPRVNQITFVGCSQIAKSACELNMIGYTIDQDPGSMLYIQPTEGDAKKFSRVRVAPMIRNSRRLKSKVSDVKTRDSNNTILQKSFPGGMITMTGSNAPNALASTPCRYVIGDEIDRWATSAGTEGDPWELVKARTITFYNHKLVAVSTPTIKGGDGVENGSKIESLYNEGTRETWCHQCPECGEWHAIKFEDIRFEHEEKKINKKIEYHVNSVEWACPSCGCLSSEDIMKRQPAKWIAENPDAISRGHRSFWIRGFASPWMAWDKIIYDYLLAGDNPNLLQVVHNTKFGELFEDRGELQDEDVILNRREKYGTRDDRTPIDLPDGVLCLTCGVDTQDNRLEYEIVGHGHYGETWGIKKGIIMGDPDDTLTWHRLDGIVDKTYYYRNRKKRGIKITLTFVDSGGNKTKSVYMQCKKRHSKRVFAIKGKSSADGVPFTDPPKIRKIVDKKTKQAIGQVLLFIIGVDAGKAMIMSNLKEELPGPKYCHFPEEPEKGYDEKFVAGLLSERRVLRRRSGRTSYRWEKIPGHERNEALDCRNYALAAFDYLDPDLDALEKRLNELPKNETIEVQAAPRKKRKKKTANLGDGW